MRPFPRALITAAVLAAPLAAFAQASPVGLWKTIDDETKQEKSLVRISEAGGVVSAKIEKLLDPTKQDAVCDKCSDERKGQRIVGMTIVRNVKQNADDKALWDGGEILDPNNGKTYKVRLKPVDGGKALEVRGYIGAPLLGRTQTWQRVE
ncbi:DUF2147 domain-containing protein [Piscinibacter sakaiensis]|uniref:DUF2147 domain-containing protein n=1 Tax=Piscinibacter sakaiensis TaxID=1547922 RepID=A0A0K8P4I3_PISS1|nr:DUF2147 domain-containing protein [Piscinibacter sakaiensis]GAP37070.1 hypothetical protein ISF6_2925 [Piscinibacter sakaiensis]